LSVGARFNITVSAYSMKGEVWGMGSLYLFLTVVVIVMLGVICATIFDRIRVVKLLILSIILFICQYILFSCILLVANVFQVMYVLIVCLVCNSIVLLWVRRTIVKGINNIDFSFRSELPILLMVVILIPFISIKSEPIEMAFDAGIYAAKTIDLINGETSSKKELKEYSMITENDRIKLMELQYREEGLYPTLSDSKNPMFEYHGLPTWPAMMALSAQIGGFGNMGQISTILFIILAFSFYYILEKWNSNAYAKYVGVILLCFTPLTIYLSKITLSDMFFTSFVMLSVFLVIQNEFPLQIIGGIAFGMLGAIHMSFFISIPVISLCFLLLSVKYKEKIYARCNYLMIVVYIMSIFFSLKVTEEYTRSQYMSMFGKNSHWIMIGMLAVMVVVQFLFTTSWEKMGNVVVNFFEQNCKIIMKISMIVLGIVSLANGILLSFTNFHENGAAAWRYREYYLGGGIKAFAHINIVSIFMATSYICIPIIVYYIFKKGDWNFIQKILGMVVVYSLAVNTILRIDTPINYYCSRYFLPVLITSIIALTTSFVKTDRIMKIVVITCLVTSLPFNIALLVTAEYAGYYDYFEEINSIIPEGIMVFIDPEDVTLSRTLVVNLREANDNEIFHIDSLQSLEKTYPEKEKYIISASPIFENRYYPVWKKTYKFTEEMRNFDVVYPLKTLAKEQDVYVYEYTKETKEIDGRIADDISGVYSGEAMNWTSRNSDFRFRFEPKGKVFVNMTYLGVYPEIIESMGGGFEIEFSMYGQVIHEETITSSEDGIISFEVPKELLANRFQHIISITSDAWRPKDFWKDSDDARVLGFAFSEIWISESEYYESVKK
jgi:4-amino-4-deoxy-L-arabinose transferase and related glycosyltransferases of PMT family